MACHSGKGRQRKPEVPSSQRGLSAFWKGWTMVFVRYEEALMRNTHENKVEVCGNKMYRITSTKAK